MNSVLNLWTRLRKSTNEGIRKLRNLPPKDVRSILVIRFSSIGDIVLTTPILRALKSRYPDDQIHILTNSQYASILEANPYVDQIVTLDERFADTLDFLRKLDVDIIVDLHKNIRSRRVHSGLRHAQYYTYSKLNIRKWLLVNLKIQTLPLKSIVTRYFEGLSKLDLYDDQLGLDYHIPQGAGIDAPHDLPMSHQVGYVACVVGGTYYTKKMPVERWLDLCQQIDYPMIIVGCQEDREVGLFLEKNVSNKKVYNACGKFDLHESADIISRAISVIAHDTGMMHIAAAFQKPIITLWGNTVERFGMFPYMPLAPQKYSSAEVKISCRPCSKLGHQKCPKKHFNCMQNQNTANILKDLKKSIILAN